MKLSAHAAVRLTLQTDSDQFESLIREHQSMVFRMLMRLTGSREHLEDLAQEVFLRLCRGMQHFRGDANVSTYLYRIVVNVAQDDWKRRRRERGLQSFSDEETGWEDRLPSGAESADASLQQRQIRAIVEAAMAELSDPERAVIVLFHQEECSYEQIAVALKLPIGTVRTHLHRGREKLKMRVRERMNVCARMV